MDCIAVHLQFRGLTSAVPKKSVASNATFVHPILAALLPQVDLAPTHQLAGVANQLFNFPGVSAKVRPPRGKVPRASGSIAYCHSSRQASSVRRCSAISPIGCVCRRWSDILLAGIVMGPITPGFVADAGLASQLAEMGVILLMFGVGLHFSAADLLAVRGSPCRARSSRSLIATLLGVGLVRMVGLGPRRGHRLRPQPVGSQHRSCS